MSAFLFVRVTPPRPRGRCPVCRRMRPLRVDGTVSPHGWTDPDGDVHPCAGSGQLYQENPWGRTCRECLNCGLPDGPALLTHCGHASCNVCGPKYVR